jgi:hypothetical protein
MKSKGFELQRQKNHLVWRHHTGVKIHTASTPSCRHSLNQVKRDVRRKFIQMGIRS